MGLFGFGKKKSSFKSPQQFYNDCVIDFHQTANTLGCAKKGLIAIPELGPVGQTTVLAFLKDNFFQMEYGRDPRMYYYVIMSLSLQAGMVLAKKWHEDFPGLQDAVKYVMVKGPADEAYKILSDEFNIDKEAFNKYAQAIFERWTVMHEPYWKLADPRDYTFSAMTAAFQLGVSMTLEKYGY